MNPRNTLLTLAILLGAVALAPACKSESGDAKSEEKAENSGASAASVTPGKVAVPDKGEPAPPVAELVAPGKVTIDQAIAAMGRGAEQRLEVRIKPLVDSGLVELAMGAIPASDRAEYDTFVAESGFDPVKQFSGVLAYGNGDLQQLDQNGGTIVVGIDGGISEQLIAYLDARDKDDADEKDDKNRLLSFVLLADLTPEAQNKLIDAILADEAEETVKTERRDLDGAIYLVKPDDQGTRYMFVWSGGIVIGRVLSQGKAPFEAPLETLKQTLGELAAASKADTAGSNVAITGRGSANGMSAKFTLALDSTLALDLSATVPRAQRAEVEQVIAALPEMKKTPEVLLSKAPPFAHALVKLVLAGTEVTLDGDEVLAAVRLDLAQLKAALAPILEATASR